MIIRKVRTGIKKILSQINNLVRHFIIYLLEEEIKIGNNVSIGKNVTLKTTDGGKIVIGDNVSIEANSFIYAQKGEIRIGENGFIGMGSQIVAKNSIMIGSDSLISAYSVIRDANHSIEKNSLINSQGHTIKEIVIEDDVWLGAHSVVTAGCHIGKGAVVGANAVVTKDVKSYTVVGGVPATFIKERT